MFKKLMLVVLGVTFSIATAGASELLSPMTKEQAQRDLDAGVFLIHNILKKRGKLVIDEGGRLRTREITLGDVLDDAQELSLQDLKRRGSMSPAQQKKVFAKMKQAIDFLESNNS